MRIKVNPHSIKIIEKNSVNEKEININKCYFEFSEEITNDYVKEAYFTLGEHTYKQIIQNNECSIPYEVLEQKGKVEIGVVAFKVEDEETIKRYNPMPVSINTLLGSLKDADNSEPITPTDKEQMEQAIQKNSNDIETLEETKQDTLVSGENIKTINGESVLGSGNLNVEVDLSNYYTKQETYSKQEVDGIKSQIETEIPTKVSQLINDEGFIDKEVNDLENYTKTSDLSSVATSGDYDDLIDKPDLSVYATTTALGEEKTARENADIGLQEQIDGISASSDVVDIVGTYTELQNYDTTHLGNNDIIKVLQDSTHNNAMTYYRWNKTNSQWIYVGQEGPYYTKSEIDTTLLPYVKNTDYATDSKGGVIRANSTFGLNMSNGNLFPINDSYSNYQTRGNNYFISKGTLENVITGKDLTTKAYVDGLVGDIESILETLDVGSGV